MSVDHNADIQRVIAWFREGGWVATARGTNAVFVGVPVDYEDGMRVLEPTLFLELHGEQWCLRRYRFGGSVEDGPCLDLDRALDLAAHLLTLQTSELAGYFTSRKSKPPIE